MNVLLSSAKHITKMYTVAHQLDFYLLIAIGIQNVGCHAKFLNL